MDVRNDLELLEKKKCNLFEYFVISYLYQTEFISVW